MFEEGTYDYEITDSYGDGLNGATLEFTQEVQDGQYPTPKQVGHFNHNSQHQQDPLAVSQEQL